MYKLICATISKPRTSVTGFTTTYKKVARNQKYSSLIKLNEENEDADPVDEDFDGSSSVPSTTKTDLMDAADDGASSSKPTVNYLLFPKRYFIRDIPMPGYFYHDIYHPTSCTERMYATSRDWSKKQPQKFIRKKPSKMQITYPTNISKHNMPFSKRFKIRQGSSDPESMKLVEHRKKMIMRAEANKTEYPTLKVKQQQTIKNIPNPQPVDVFGIKVIKKIELPKRIAQVQEEEYEEPDVKNHPTIRSASNENKMKLKARFASLLIKHTRLNKTKASPVAVDSSPDEIQREKGEAAEHEETEEPLPNKEVERLLEARYPKTVWVDTPKTFDVHKICEKDNRKDTISYNSLEKPKLNYSNLEKEAKELSKFVNKLKTLRDTTAIVDKIPSKEYKVQSKEDNIPSKEDKISSKEGKIPNKEAKVTEKLKEMQTERVKLVNRLKALSSQAAIAESLEMNLTMQMKNNKDNPPVKQSPKTEETPNELVKKVSTETSEKLLVTTIGNKRPTLTNKGKLTRAKGTLDTPSDVEILNLVAEEKRKRAEKMKTKTTEMKKADEALEEQKVTPFNEASKEQPQNDNIKKTEYYAKKRKEWENILRGEIEDAIKECKVTGEARSPEHLSNIQIEDDLQEISDAKALYAREDGVAVPLNSKRAIENAFEQRKIMEEAAPPEHLNNIKTEDDLQEVSNAKPLDDREDGVAVEENKITEETAPPKHLSNVITEDDLQEISSRTALYDREDTVALKSTDQNNSLIVLEDTGTPNVDHNKASSFSSKDLNNKSLVLYDEKKKDNLSADERTAEEPVPLWSEAVNEDKTSYNKDAETEDLEEESNIQRKQLLTGCSFLSKSERKMKRKSPIDGKDFTKNFGFISSRYDPKLQQNEDNSFLVTNQELEQPTDVENEPISAKEDQDYEQEYVDFLLANRNINDQSNKDLLRVAEDLDFIAQEKARDKQKSLEEMKNDLKNSLDCIENSNEDNLACEYNQVEDLNSDLAVEREKVLRNVKEASSDLAEKIVRRMQNSAFLEDQECSHTEGQASLDMLDDALELKEELSEKQAQDFENIEVIDEMLEKVKQLESKLQEQKLKKLTSEMNYLENKPRLPAIPPRPNVDKKKDKQEKAKDKKQIILPPKRIVQIPNASSVDTASAEPNNKTGHLKMNNDVQKGSQEDQPKSNQISTDIVYVKNQNSKVLGGLRKLEIKIEVADDEHKQQQLKPKGDPDPPNIAMKKKSKTFHHDACRESTEANKWGPSILFQAVKATSKQTQGSVSKDKVSPSKNAKGVATASSTPTLQRRNTIEYDLQKRSKGYILKSSQNSNCPSDGHKHTADDPAVKKLKECVIGKMGVKPKTSSHKSKTEASGSCAKKCEETKPKKEDKCGSSVEVKKSKECVIHSTKVTPRCEEKTATNSNKCAKNKECDSKPTPVAAKCEKKEPVKQTCTEVCKPKEKVEAKCDKKEPVKPTCKPKDPCEKKVTKDPCEKKVAKDTCEKKPKECEPHVKKSKSSDDCSGSTSPELRKLKECVIQKLKGKGTGTKDKGKSTSSCEEKKSKCPPKDKPKDCPPKCPPKDKPKDCPPKCPPKDKPKPCPPKKCISVENKEDTSQCEHPKMILRVTLPKCESQSKVCPKEDETETSHPKMIKGTKRDDCKVLPKALSHCEVSPQSNRNRVRPEQSQETKNAEIIRKDLQDCSTSDKTQEQLNAAKVSEQSDCEENSFNIVEEVPAAFECPSDDLQDRRRTNTYYRYHQKSYYDLYEYLKQKRTFAEDDKCEEIECVLDEKEKDCK